MHYLFCFISEQVFFNIKTKVLYPSL